MLYRALRDLDNGIKRGELFPGSRLSQRAIPILEARGAIAAVQSPPLRDLPVWNDRQAELGVETLAEVVELDPAEARRPGEVEEWQKQAKALLQYPAPDGWYLKEPEQVKEECGGCQKRRASANERKARRKGNGGQ